MRLSNRFHGAACLGILAMFVLATSASYAGFFSDVGTYLKERKNIWSHSKNITSGVKELYRERKSIRRFSDSANTLVRAYHGIRNKSLKSNFPKLIEIAQAITGLVMEYQNLQPKASRLYSKVKPDLNYFAKLKGKNDDFMDASKKFVVKSFSDNRINKLSGAAGWGRVWDSVKENSFNVFRWGKLRDEYKYGKAEAKYPLKCAQIAFETMSYYEAANGAVQSLLGIKSEINGLLNGNLDALLGIGNTVNRIENASEDVNSLGSVLNQGVSNINKRFTELIAVQDEYVKIHKEYQQKYNKNPSTPTGTNASSGSSSSAYSGTSSAHSGYSSTTTTSPGTYNTQQDLNNAMEYYRRTYMEYTKIVQNSQSSREAVQKALNDLQEARRMLDQAKKRASQ